MGGLVTASFGDVVLAAGGTYTSKPRPVLIFQNDSFSTGESTVVIPFTSSENPAAYYRVGVVPTPTNGLDRRCWLEVDKVAAIRTAWLGKRVGRLDSDVLRQTMDKARRLMFAEDDNSKDTSGPSGLWTALQELVDGSEIRVDRPRGSKHPRFPEIVYPVDYGYLGGTVGGDGDGIDCWVGGDGTDVVGLFVTVDPHKRDGEIKLLLGCGAEQIAEIAAFYEPLDQRAMLIKRTDNAEPNAATV